MRLTIQIAMTDESGDTRIEDVLTLDKSQKGHDDIGLSISDTSFAL